MNETKYDFLERTIITVHQDQESQVSGEALDELKRYEHVQFYNRERMMVISRAGRVQDEINKLVRSILTERDSYPEGSSTVEPSTTAGTSSSAARFVSQTNH